MLKSGKPAGQQLAATSSTGHQVSHLFYVTDRWTKLRLLIDKGTEVSSVPQSHTQQKHQCQGPSLQAVNNTRSSTYGTCSLTLDLGLRHTFRWVFIITDISKRILSVDFLKHYGLLVSKGISFPEQCLKATLWKTVEENQPCSPIYVVAGLVTQAGMS